MNSATHLMLDRAMHRPMFLTEKGQISTADFLSHVAALAERLPDKPYAINYCENHYEFAVTFFAVLLRGQCNVLLPGHQAGLLKGAARQFSDAYVVTAGSLNDSPLPMFDMSGVKRNSGTTLVPLLPADQLAAIVYTSGTTGISKSIEKTVGSLFYGAKINSGVLHESLSLGRNPAIVATAPPWHMYGLEWSLLVSCVSDIAIFSGSTLFPGDVIAALKLVGEDNCFVSTPHHLRALYRSGMDISLVRHLLSATAPLNDSLAMDLLDSIHGDLLEIYGCSEAGSFACRSSVAADWQQYFRCFSEFTMIEEDGVVILSAPHLAHPVKLSDELYFSENGGFSIVGRDADLIKVAGKRASLADLNATLLSLDSVIDGVVLPPQIEGGRLLILVVLQDGDAAAVEKALAGLIEQSFLPRRVRQVDALPRDETGKLKQVRLQALLQAEGVPVKSGKTQDEVSGLA